MGFAKFLAGTTAIAAILGAAGTANADRVPERHGWYVGAEAGYGKVQDTSIGSVGLLSDIEFDSYRAYFGEVGYAFQPYNWRLELEGGFRDNHIDSVFPGRLCNANRLCA